MAKKYRSSFKRSDAYFINVEVGDLLKKIEQASSKGVMKRALINASYKGIGIVERSMRSFISQHRRTGRTEESLMKPSEVVFLEGKEALKRWKEISKGKVKKQVGTKDESDIIFFEYGFKESEGGLPALFLDIGTKAHGKHPGQKGHFFIYYSVADHMSEIHKVQAEELKEILKELGG